MPRFDGRPPAPPRGIAFSGQMTQAGVNRLGRPTIWPIIGLVVNIRPQPGHPSGARCASAIRSKGEFGLAAGAS